MSVAFFVFSRKNPRQGYLLGLIPIFLFWQIACIFFLWREARNPCQEFCGFFETGAGAFIIILIVFYTIWGRIVRRIYSRATRKALIPRRSIRSMAAVELPFFLAILFLSMLSALGLYAFSWWSIVSGNLIFSLLFFLGYGNSLLLEQGITAFTLANVLILALSWILYTRFSGKQGGHPLLESSPASGGVNGTG